MTVYNHTALVGVLDRRLPAYQARWSVIQVLPARGRSNRCVVKAQAIVFGKTIHCSIILTDDERKEVLICALCSAS